ncbi:MAG TPA: EthD domain-containing protein [Chakrabartia sp.]|jgi:hypothetical protein|nr:EthD domain-containing protein [Chakrabartia sp.]
MSGCKVIALLKKRDGLSRAEFIAYYETHHAPLILSLFPQITGYRRNFADFDGAYVYPNAAAFDFDCVTEISFARRPDYDAFGALAATPEVADQISADEKHFLDQSYTRMFLVGERTSLIS